MNYPFTNFRNLGFIKPPGFERESTQSTQPINICSHRPGVQIGEEINTPSHVHSICTDTVDFIARGD